MHLKKTYLFFILDTTFMFQSFKTIMFSRFCLIFFIFPTANNDIKSSLSFNKKHFNKSAIKITIFENRLLPIAK